MRKRQRESNRQTDRQKEEMRREGKNPEKSKRRRTKWKGQKEMGSRCQSTQWETATFSQTGLQAISVRLRYVMKNAIPWILNPVKAGAGIKPRISMSALILIFQSHLATCGES